MEVEERQVGAPMVAPGFLGNFANVQELLHQLMNQNEREKKNQQMFYEFLNKLEAVQQKRV